MESPLKLWSNGKLLTPIIFFIMTLDMIQCEPPSKFNYNKWGISGAIFGDYKGFLNIDVRSIENLWQTVGPIYKYYPPQDDGKDNGLPYGTYLPVKTELTPEDKKWIHQRLSPSINGADDSSNGPEIPLLHGLFVEIRHFFFT